MCAQGCCTGGSQVRHLNRTYYASLPLCTQAAALPRAVATHGRYSTHSFCTHELPRLLGARLLLPHMLRAYGCFVLLLRPLELLVSPPTHLLGNTSGAVGARAQARLAVAECTLFTVCALPSLHNFFSTWHTECMGTHTLTTEPVLGQIGTALRIHNAATVTYTCIDRHYGTCIDRHYTTWSGDVIDGGKDRCW